MSVYPIVWQPVAATGDYPHLQRRDVATWETWLAQYAREWEAVAYDVAIGGLEPDAPNLTEQDKLGWRYTTALKIDVLLRGADKAIVVVEVKPAASIAALGAALGYPILLAGENPDLGTLTSGIITAHLPPAIEQLAKHFDVRTWLV